MGDNAARITVVIKRELAELIEFPRYSGQPMFVTHCVVTWRSNPDYKGNHFSITVLGARRKKNGEPMNECLDKTVYGDEVGPWLERAGVSNDTIAQVLANTADGLDYPQTS